MMKPFSTSDSPRPVVSLSPTIVPPPPHSPNWTYIGDLPLVYLGWGERYYRSNPIPISAHPGWPYMVILKGECSLVLKNERRKVTTGDIFLIHPECASGWDSEESTSCQLLSFIWRIPPHQDLCLDPSQPLYGNADGGELNALKKIHQECREEVTLQRPYFQESIHLLHQRLQILFLRVLHRSSNKLPASTKTLLLQRAVEWMRQHLPLSHSLKDLCDYLEITPRQLGHLFRHELKTTPEKYLRSLRMTEIIRLKEESGLSQKEIAHQFGYQHANDLSRALSHYLPFQK